MDIEGEIKVRDAIKYCIENFDSKTATNRIVEFWKDELELQQKQCNIANVSGSLLSFEQCLREEFLVNTQNYPKEYHNLFHQKFEKAKKRFREQSGSDC